MSQQFIVGSMTDDQQRACLYKVGVYCGPYLASMPFAGPITRCDNHSVVIDDVEQGPVHLYAGDDFRVRGV